MWRELITQLDTKSEIVLSAPVAEDQLIDVEQSLAIQFPDNLRGLLLETDGITDIFGVQIIWSIDWIKRNNLANRQDDLVANTFAQYGNLLFFADAGNGDEYAFLITKDKVEKGDVYGWKHEDDKLEWAAASLEEYLKILVST